MASIHDFIPGVFGLDTFVKRLFVLDTLGSLEIVEQYVGSVVTSPKFCVPRIAITTSSRISFTKTLCSLLDNSLSRTNPRVIGVEDPIDFLRIFVNLCGVAQSSVFVLVLTLTYYEFLRRANFALLSIVKYVFIIFFPV